MLGFDLYFEELFTKSATLAVLSKPLHCGDSQCGRHRKPEVFQRLGTKISRFSQWGWLKYPRRGYPKIILKSRACWGYAEVILAYKYSHYSCRNIILKSLVAKNVRILFRSSIKPPAYRPEGIVNSPQWQGLKTSYFCWLGLVLYILQFKQFSLF